jgi:membrane associated rhomboid family serine protease
MIPLRDENPTRSFPIFTLLIIAANVLVFLWQLSVGLNVSVLQMGLIPAELLHDANRVYTGGPRTGLPPGAEVTNLNPAWMTLFTSMFMHGGWMHIIANMWFLWIFGNNIEDSLGKVKFILFYLACGLAAAAAQTALDPASPIPMVGASGAIAGILGAYLVLFPGSRILALVPLGFVLMVREVPAWLVLGLWFVLEFVRGIGALGADAAGGVAYGAHVGGFVFGWLFIRLLGAERHPRRPDSRSEPARWR